MTEPGLPQSGMGMKYFPDRDREDPGFKMPPVISRQEHYDEFAKDYENGQHLTEIGPTQRGKSKMGKDMLKRVTSPERTAIVLSGKPFGRERTWTKDSIKELDFMFTRKWPPPLGLEFLFKRRKMHGWLLQPIDQMAEADKEEQMLIDNFHPAIMSNYRSRKPTITVVDEGHQLQVDLGLKKTIEAPLMRGAPDNAVWTFLQRGRFVSYLTYDSPEHIIAFRDDDRANQERYSEIGGVDARYFAAVVRRLAMKRVKTGGTISQAAYFRRKDTDIRIVDT